MRHGRRPVFRPDLTAASGGGEIGAEHPVEDIAEQCGLNTGRHDSAATVFRGNAFPFESTAKPYVISAHQLDQRTPDTRGQPILDQQVPQPVRPLVQIRHRQIGRHRAPLPRPPPPKDQSTISPSNRRMISCRLWSDAIAPLALLAGAVAPAVDAIPASLPAGAGILPLFT